MGEKNSETRRSVQPGFPTSRWWIALCVVVVAFMAVALLGSVLGGEGAGRIVVCVVLLVSTSYTLWESVRARRRAAQPGMRTPQDGTGLAVSPKHYRIRLVLSGLAGAITAGVLLMLLKVTAESASWSSAGLEGLWIGLFLWIFFTVLLLRSSRR